MKSFVFFVLIPAFLLTAGLPAFGQDTKRLKLKKDRNAIYFFQKGTASNQLLEGQNDVFYLLVPDSLKPNIIINAENAELVQQSNDSLVLCKVLPGIRYEHYYRLDAERKFRYVVGVNGASVVAPPLILIQFTDKRTGIIIFENRFYYTSP